MLDQKKGMFVQSSNSRGGDHTLETLTPLLMEGDLTKKMFHPMTILNSQISGTKMDGLAIIKENLAMIMDCEEFLLGVKLQGKTQEDTHHMNRNYRSPKGRDCHTCSKLTENTWRFLTSHSMHCTFSSIKESIQIYNWKKTLPDQELPPSLSQTASN